MIHSMHYSAKGILTADLPPAKWPAALRSAHGTLWVDFDAEQAESVEPLLRDIFHFHPLAIDDALREAHIPKIDNWGDYAYAVVHAVAFDADSLELQTLELDVFLGRNYIVTHHRQALDAIQRLWTACRSDQSRLARGPDYLLYELLDLVTSDYMPVVDQIDETCDQLEDEVFDRPSQHTLNTIFTLKRAVLHLRRIISPQREVLNRLARDEYRMIDPEDRVYFRDVYDHLVRLVDINDTLRDLISGTLDTYLSVSSNRINEVMKVLTIFTALFMPISFLAGFFGMNFAHLPFNNPALLITAIAVMVLTPLTMYLWFRSRGWV